MSGTTRWWYPVILVLQVISGNSIPSPSVCYTNYIVDSVPVCVTPTTLWTQSQCVLHQLHFGPNPSMCYTDYIMDPVPVRVTLITLWTQSQCVLHWLHCGPSPVCVKLITLWTQSQRVLHQSHCGPSASVTLITLWTQSSAGYTDYIVDPVPVQCVLH